MIDAPSPNREFGQGAVTAGPQLAHFTLTRPNPSGLGYLVNVCTAC